MKLSAYLFLLTAILFVQSNDGVLAQSNGVVITRTSTTEYPRVVTDFYFFDASGSNINPKVSDYRIEQDGIAVTSVQSSSGPKVPMPVSLGILIDNSFSGAAAGSLVHNHIRAAATAANSTLAAPSDECAIVAYDRNPNLLFPLSSQRDQVDNVLASLSSSRGSSINSALTMNSIGLFSQLRGARYNRAAILFVNGAESATLREAISTALAFRIRVYVFGVGASLSPALKEMADTTGGFWRENVTDADHLKALAIAATLHAKQVQPSSASFTLPDPCKSSSILSLHNISVPEGQSDIIHRQLPVALASRLDFSTRSLWFGEIPLGSQVTRSFTITARNEAATINGIMVGNAVFSLTGPQLPLTLEKDESATFQVSYTGSDSASMFTAITLDAQGVCGHLSVFCKAGYVSKDQNFRLTKPAGSDVLVAGIPTNIEWTGMLPSDYISLEYSTNGGSQWKPIRMDASGLQQSWVPGPEVSSSVTLRGSWTNVGSDEYKEFKNHTEPVYTVAFVNDGKTLAAGSHDFTVSLTDVTGVNPVKILQSHTAWVWAIAAHPSAPVIASAGHDGRIMIWNSESGEAIGEYVLNSRLWSVVFSQDGKRLYAGAESSIFVIDMDAGIILQRQVVENGPVYGLSIHRTSGRLVCAEGSHISIRSLSDLSLDFTFQPANQSIYCVSSSPNSSLIAFGSADLMTYVYDINSNTIKWRTQPGLGSILSVHFSSGGDHVLVGSGDGTAIIYNADNGNLLGRLAGHRGLVYATAYSPDSKMVATGATDRNVRLWDISKLFTLHSQPHQPFSITGGLGQGVSSIGVGTTLVKYGLDIITPAVFNVNEDTVVVRGIAFVSGDVSQFDIAYEQTPIMLGRGDTMAVKIVYNPTTTGVHNAILNVYTGRGTIEIPVTGTAVHPRIEIPSIINFGRRLASGAEVDTTIMVSIPEKSNYQSAEVTAITLSGIGASSYQVVPLNAFTLNRTGQHQIQIRLKLVPGRHVATLEFTFREGNKQVVSLYGESFGDAQIMATPNLIFPTNPCKAESSMLSASIVSAGTMPLTITGIGLVGAHESEFRIKLRDTSVSFPVILARHDTLGVDVTYIAQRVGSSSAHIVVLSNAINAPDGQTRINLTSRKDTAAFRSSRSTILFSKVHENSSVVDSFTVTNTGTISLTWPVNAITLGSFVIERFTPSVTLPGQTSTVVVRFIGGEAGKTYRESYNLVEPTCSVTESVEFVAFVNTYIGMTIKAGIINAVSGSRINVPIYVTNKINFERTQVKTASLTIRVNSTLLHPAEMQMQDFDYDKGNSRLLIPVTLTIPVGTDSVGISIPFKTYWGNDTSSMIEITNVQVNDTILVITENGYVHFNDVCRKGGPRLFSWIQESSLKLLLLPTPVSPYSTSVAVLTPGLAGNVVIDVLDIMGRVIISSNMEFHESAKHHIPIDMSPLNTGVYVLRATTAQGVVSTHFDVVK